MLNEFISKMGFDKTLGEMFQTKETATWRWHTDAQNLMQVIFQLFSAYFADDCADELTEDPVFTAVLSKPFLALQPTLSRFHNRMDCDTLAQFDEIGRALRHTVYSCWKPPMVLLDLDSTLLETYGNQEGEAYNFHYGTHGYHPLLYYDGMTRDC